MSERAARMIEKRQAMRSLYVDIFRSSDLGTEFPPSLDMAAVVVLLTFVFSPFL